MKHAYLGNIITNRNTGAVNKVITHCPFCQTELIAYDQTYDLFTCRNKQTSALSSHYQLYYYGSRNAAGHEEFQELMVFDGFALAIEHPDMIWELKVDSMEDNTMIYPIEPFKMKYDYEELKQKLETYITFI